MKQYYITTAIDYANGAPHLGHAYEKVLTDVIARYRRMQGDTVHFLTGIDEHGQKITQTAQAQGKTPEELTGEMAPLFMELCAKLKISNDDFIRTTEDRHKKVVCSVLQKLFDKGDIYLGEYRGYYSVRQEQFVLEKERNEDGSWPELYGEVVEIEESNYFFKLGKYQPWLIEYLESNDFVFPLFRQKQVLAFLKEPVNDLCISRPIERLSWGIPLPFDEKYVTYVWFDALLNYISAVGYGTDDFEKYWPAEYNVIGKDILVPSHSVYWPIMLKALDVPLPKSLLVHGWWHLGGQKMSKSSGVNINPLDFVDDYGADALRFFMIREMSVGQDSDFTEELFFVRYNSDLANNLGNLLSRLLNMGGRHFPGGCPSSVIEEKEEVALKQLWAETQPAVLAAFEGFQFHLGLEKLFTFITAINRYTENRAPWKLAKSDDPLDQKRLATSIATMAEALRLASIMFNPVMPDISAKVQTLLGVEPVSTWAGELDWSETLAGKSFGEKTILFPRPKAES